MHARDQPNRHTSGYLVWRFVCLRQHLLFSDQWQQHPLT